MRAFPVEDRRHARFVGQVIAGAVVAVDQHRRRGRRGLAAVEPRKRQLEHRLRLAQQVELAAQAGDVIGRFAMRERRQALGIDGMDARQDLAELARDRAARLFIGRIA